MITSFFLGLISFGQGSNFTYIVCYTLMAGTLGFLIFNFPKGKLFMGDVGSTFLGFTFATLAIISSLYDNAHTSMLVIPLLLFHFIYDTFFTFLRRLIAKENVFQAHKTHLYQLFNQLGYSHTFVTFFYCATGLAQGFGAFWIINIQGLQKLLVFIPYMAFQIIYSMVILYFAKKTIDLKTSFTEHLANSNPYRGSEPSRQIPLQGFVHTGFKGFFWRIPQFRRNLAGINGIPPVMPGPVLNIINQIL